MKTLFTSESVSEGHPDKMADQISDALLDNYLAFDSNSKVACETLVTTDQVIIAGEIKSNSKTEETPIIILTAKDDEVDKVVGFELGADDYVTKPFSVRELILRVKAILKRSDTKTKEVVEVERQFGDLKIDVDSHEVHVDSQLIELTALEFRLLKELVDKRGRVQSRDQLLSEVWGYNAEVTTRTVDTHIKRLREKLGSMGKYVQTIRGVGYKFSRTPD